MSRIAIVTDSSAYLPADLVAQHGIHVVPLYVHFGDAAFRDGVDLKAAEFFDKLAAAPALPTTSQPSAGDFVALYRRLASEVDAIVSLHLSSCLSGTVGSAQAARQTLEAEAADGGAETPEIHVIDTLVTAGALGLLVTAAAKLVAAGVTAEAVVNRIQDLIPTLNVIFAVDTLKYLHKGGRIGGASALIGSVVQIKPILTLNEGRIDALEKVRTAKKAQRRLVEIMQERVSGSAAVHVAVFHAAAPAVADVLKAEVTRCFAPAELMVCELSPVIASHVGPGTVALAFYQES